MSSDTSKVVQVVADRVRRAEATVAVAESLTSGRLASALGAGEGASEWFFGGVVAYRLSVKEQLLGLPPGTDPCSAECARHLAASVRTLLGTAIGISLTGVGGPDPHDGHGPGTVYLGWATAEGSDHRLLRIGGDPEEVIDESVTAAIELLGEIAGTIS